MSKLTKIFPALQNVSSTSRWILTWKYFPALRTRYRLENIFRRFAPDIDLENFLSMFCNRYWVENFLLVIHTGKFFNNKTLSGLTSVPNILQKFSEASCQVLDINNFPPSGSSFWPVPVAHIFRSMMKHDPSRPVDQISTHSIANNSYLPPNGLSFYPAAAAHLIENKKKAKNTKKYIFTLKRLVNEMIFAKKLNKNYIYRNIGRWSCYGQP